MRSTIILLIISLLIITGCRRSLVITEDIETLKAAVEKDPNDGVAYYNLGVGYLANDDFSEALKYFNKSIEREPEFSAAHFALYCTKYKVDKKLFIESLKDDPDTLFTGKLDSVRAHLNLALQYDPFFNWQLMVILIEAKGSEYLYTPDLYQLFYEKLYDGFEQFFLGNSKGAVEKLTHTISFYPEYRQARFIRGLAHAQDKNYDAAIADFKVLIDSIETSNQKKILPIYLKSSELYYITGVAQLQKGDFDSAIKSFKKVLSQDMSYYMAHLQLSRSYESKKEFAKAIQELDAAILAAPRNSLLHYNKAVFLSRVGKLDQSINSYKKSLELNKYRYEAYFNLAEIYFKNKDYKSALLNFKEFMNYTPIYETGPIAKAKEMIEQLSSAGNSGSGS